MNHGIYDINLSGYPSITYNKVKTELKQELSKHQYPLRIIESSESEIVALSYRDEVIDFNQMNLDDSLNKMKALLPKINPKTGKICRCSNCKNCPSKRFNQIS
jgi:hypothetical protein